MEEYSKLLAKIEQGSRELNYLFETYFLGKSIKKIHRKRGKINETISELENLIRKDKVVEKARDEKWKKREKIDKINKPSYLEDALKAAQRLNRDHRVCYLYK